MVDSSEVLDSSEKALAYTNRVLPVLRPQTAVALEGGYVNYVWRLSCRPDESFSLPGWASAPSTIVLKSYPPYIRTNPSKPFPIERCAAELTALQLCVGCSQYQDGNMASVRLPRILHYDLTSSCIIMEDAGEDLISLTACLTQTPPGTHEVPDSPQQLLTCWPEMTAQLLIQLLHSFLAVKMKPHGDHAAFVNVGVWKALGEYSAMASKLSLSYNVPGLSALIDAAAPVEAPPQDLAASLIFGDLWPNSIQLSPSNKAVWLLDWEMARRGEPLTDANQLMDNLWIMTQNPAKYRLKAVQEVMHEVQVTYFGDVDWRIGRAPDFVRTVLLLSSFPHWELGSCVSSVLCNAVEEASKLQRE